MIMSKLILLVTLVTLVNPGTSCSTIVTLLLLYFKNRMKAKMRFMMIKNMMHFLAHPFC